MDGDIRRCKYVWKTSNFPNRNEEILSPSFRAENNDFLTWFLCCYTDDNDWSSVELVATSAHEINQHGPYSGIFSIYTLKDNKKSYFCERKFILSEDVQQTCLNNKGLPFCFELDAGKTDPEYVRFRPYNFTVVCEIYFYKMNYYFAPKSISYPKIKAFLSEVKISNPLEDFGKLYLNEEHSDFTIYINYNGKQSKYPAHKIVLSVRSKVFEAMFRHNMTENNRNYIVVEDIKEKVFLEALRYIYTGRANIHNLKMIYKLLPVADRYDLENLRIACSDGLREKLSEQTALKTVILADMHNLVDLKIDAIKFIKDHSEYLARMMDSEAWGDLMARPHLMKDLLLANMEK